MNKINLLRLYAIDHQPTLILVTETWASDELNDAFFSVSGYSLYRSDRIVTTGGGVMVYVSNKVPSSFVSAHAELRAEAISCFLQISPNTSLAVSCVYVPPDYVLHGSPVLNHLKTITSLKSDYLIICGDFNSPDICWNSSNSPPSSFPLLKWSMDAFLHQHVRTPTRPESQNILDLIFSDTSTVIENLAVGERFGASDHSIITFTVPFGNFEQHSYNPHVPLFSKADWKLFQKTLFSSSWCCNWSTVSVDCVWKQYSQNIVRAISVAVPSRNKKQWSPLNASKVRTSLRNVKRMFRECSMAPTHVNKTKLSLAKSCLNESIKQAILAHEKAIANSFTDNPQRFWSYVKGKLNSKSVITSIKDNDGSEVSDCSTVAENFNDYFASIFNQGSYPAQVLSFSRHVSTAIDTVSFTPEIVYDTIKGLPNSTSCDHESLCYLVLKKGGHFLAARLSDLFSLSLTTGKLPHDWRKITVTPIHKSGSKNLCNNYRPIAITSCALRIMERIISKQLLSYLQSNHLLHDSQHGFLPRHSIDTAEVGFFDFLTHELDLHRTIEVAFFDFRKAFDTVPHDLLLRKLSAHNIRGNLFTWLRDYLSDRLQVTRIFDATSKELPISSGVIQGSVLGPTLFLLFINDLDLNIGHTKIIKYADDVKIYISYDNDEKSQTEAALHLQNDINNIENWSSENGLSLKTAPNVRL